jgi:hypothetical protein
MHKTIQKTIKNTVKKKRKFDTIPIQPPAPAPNAANLWRGWRFPFNLGFLFRVGLMLFIFGPYLLSGWLIASAIGLFILYTFLMRH